MNKTTLDRREFTLASAMAILSTAVITIWDAGCGGYSSGPTAPTQPTPEPTSAGDRVGTISNNHGHRAVITGAELMAGSSINLDIQGIATHTHTVALSAEEVLAIGNNQQVAKLSSTAEDHNHTVTFN